MSNKSYYNQLIERNYAFIESSIQEKLRCTKICFLGCGLGANIAIAAARTGLCNFLLYDSDHVEVGNLNRQPYDFTDISKPKTNQLEKKIKLINQEANVIKYIQHITIKDAVNIPLDTNVCINTIDWSKDYIEITDYLAFERDIPVIVPMNIGFGSLILIFKKGSVPFSEYIVDNNYSLEGIINNIIKKTTIHFPGYINNNIFELFVQIKQKNIEPQIMPAAALTSSLVVTIIIQLIKNESVKTSPNVIYFDLLGVIS